MLATRALHLFLCLAVAAAASLAQEGFPLFSTDFPPEEFAKRRAAACGWTDCAVPVPSHYTG